jgi:hypothetical protein
MELVAKHLDTLTGNQLKLSAVQNTLSENITSINSTISGLADANARLKRELAAQKLASNRRWFLAAILLVLYTLGQPFFRTVLQTTLWGLEHPAAAFYAMMEGARTMSLWLWVLAFPLLVLLFIHKVLNSYSVGYYTLPRTAVTLVLGIAMQLPLLYYVMNTGNDLLVDWLKPRSETTGSTASPFQHMVTLTVWFAMLVIDYALIVMHHYIQ